MFNLVVYDRLPRTVRGSRSGGGAQAADSLDRQFIARRPQAADYPRGDQGDIAVMAERFSRRRIGEMTLDDRYGEGL